MARTLPIFGPKIPSISTLSAAQAPAPAEDDEELDGRAEEEDRAGNGVRHGPPDPRCLPVRSRRPDAIDPDSGGETVPKSRLAVPYCLPEFANVIMFLSLLFPPISSLLFFLPCFSLVSSFPFPFFLVASLLPSSIFLFSWF